MKRSLLEKSRIKKFILIVILSVIVAVGSNRVTYAESDSGKEVSSFLQMEERVVEIINSSNLAGYSADVRTWRKNLDFLINNYDVIVNENDSDKEAIDRYVAEYSHVDELNEMLKTAPEKSTKSGVINLMAAEQAVYYAGLYYNSPNPAYPYWTSGGDCANFISQCLYYGGKAMIGTPSTQNVSNNTANWFSYGTTCSTINVSESWRSATGFCVHWMSRANGYSQFTPAQMAKYGAARQYAEPGDAVSLLKYQNGSLVAYHTMIVVGKTTDGDVLLAAHTSPTNNARLSVKAGQCAGCIIYRVF